MRFDDNGLPAPPDMESVPNVYTDCPLCGVPLCGIGALPRHRCDAFRALCAQFSATFGTVR